MIGRLTGRLIEKQVPRLLIDISGVGYEVEAPMSTFYQLPEVGKTITLHTHFVVREDAQLLYGFYTTGERRLFRHLIKINGVGPKLALTILSGIQPDQFMLCIQNNDSASLVKLPGVGKKTAERLIIEMRDKLKVELNDPSFTEQFTMETMAVKPVSAVDDAVSALIALGYKPVDASKAVSKVAKEDLTSEQIIKLALQSQLVSV